MEDIPFPVFDETKTEFTNKFHRGSILSNSCDFAKENGINVVSINSIEGMPSEDLLSFYDKDLLGYLEKVYLKIRKEAEKKNIYLNYWLPRVNCLEYFGDKPVDAKKSSKIADTAPQQKRSIFCDTPWHHMHIHNNMIKPECSCLNYCLRKKGQSLYEIWNGELMQTYRAKMLNNTLDWCNAKCKAGLIFKH